MKLSQKKKKKNRMKWKKKDNKKEGWPLSFWAWCLVLQNLLQSYTDPNGKSIFLRTDPFCPHSSPCLRSKPFSDNIFIFNLNISIKYKCNTFGLSGKLKFYRSWHEAPHVWVWSEHNQKQRSHEEDSPRKREQTMQGIFSSWPNLQRLQPL